MNVSWNFSVRDYLIERTPKGTIGFEFLDVTTHLSPTKQVSIFSVMSKSDSFYLYKNTPLKNLVLCLHHRLDSTKILKYTKVFSFSQLFNFTFFSNCSFKFFHHGLNQKRHSSKGSFDLKTKCYDECITRLIVPNFQT